MRPRAGFPELGWRSACLLVLIAAVVIYAARFPWSYALFVLSGLLLLIARRDALRKAAMEHLWIVVAYLLAITAVGAIKIIDSPVMVLHAGVAVSAMAVGVALTLDARAYLDASKAALIVLQAAIVIYLVIVGLADFPLDRILPNSSSNVITTTIIVLQLNYLAGKYLITGKLAVGTSLVTLAICIVGYGRGSVLAAIGIMLLHVVFPLRFDLPEWRTRFVAAIAVAFALLHGFGILQIPMTLPGVGSAWAAPVTDPEPEFYEHIPDSSKLKYGLRDRTREQAIREYVGGLSARGLLLGGSYEGTIIARELHGNPHNAFIRAHYLFGLPYMLVMALIGIFPLLRMPTIETKAFVAAVLLLVAFRAFTETMMFPTPLDVVFFAICLGLTTRANLMAIASAR